MKQKKRSFPPSPEHSYDDGEDSPRRVWALLALPDRDDKYPSSSGGYRHLRFHLVSVVDTYDDARKRIRNPGTDALGDLEVYSQGDQFEPDRLYGYGLQYKGIHHADLYKLRAMFTLLSTVERKLAALKREHGEAPDFAYFMVRVAQVFNVHYLIEKRTADPDGWLSYDRGDYRFTHLRSDGKFNGKELLWKVQSLISRLWTEADRAQATVHQQQKAEAERARREAQAEVSDVG